MTHRSLVLFLVLPLLALFTSSLHAEDRPLDDSYVALKLTLGLGGSGSVTSNSFSFAGVSASSSQSRKTSDDLELSYGLAAQYMVPVHRYFVIGGLLGITSWQSASGSDNDASRDLALDLAVVPQGRFGLLKNLELYISVPIGLTFDWLNEVSSSTTVAGVATGKIEANTAVGFMISVLLGARLALFDNFGLFTEIGWIHRAFSHDITGSGSVFGAGASAKVNADVSLSEFAWNLGAYF